MVDFKKLFNESEFFNLVYIAASSLNVDFMKWDDSLENHLEELIRQLSDKDQDLLDAKIISLAKQYKDEFRYINNFIVESENDYEKLLKKHNELSYKLQNYI